MNKVRWRKGKNYTNNNNNNRIYGINFEKNL